MPRPNYRKMLEQLTDSSIYVEYRKSGDEAATPHAFLKRNYDGEILLEVDGGDTKESCLAMLVEAGRAKFKIQDPKDENALLKSEIEELRNALKATQKSVKQVERRLPEKIKA